MTTIERIRELRLAHPFRPFYVLLKNGRRIFVERAIRLGMAPDGSRLGIAEGEQVHLLWPGEISGVDIQPELSAESKQA